MKTINPGQLKRFPQYDKHTVVYEINDLQHNLCGFIAIHRKNRTKPSFGATRFWHYVSSEEALKDALSLSKMMSYKAAISALPYGGAKGVIIAPKKVSGQEKRKILHAYAEAVNSLQGNFITGTDVGLDRKDVKFMRNYSPFMVGVRSDPTIFTALGLMMGIKVCLKESFGSGSLEGRSFAIQGLGKVGAGLLENIYNEAKTIFVADVNEKIARAMGKKFPKIKILSSQEIHKANADVFSPCALGGVLSNKTTKELHVRIIAGGANNQLSDREIGKLLYKRRILYAPDYVVNAGGLISVVDEYENKRYNESRIVKKVKIIASTLQEIFTESKKGNFAPNEVSDAMAENIFNTYE